MWLPSRDDNLPTKGLDIIDRSEKRTLFEDFSAVRLSLAVTLIHCSQFLPCRHMFGNQKAVDMNCSTSQHI